MKAVIDTSSLLSLVRYYLPFDKSDILFNLIRTKIETGEIIILDAVLQECRFVSKKLVVNKLTYLVDKEFQKVYQVPVKTDELLPISPGKFLNMLKNQLTISNQLRRLTDAEFEVQKSRYMESADAKMIMYCQHLMKDFPDDEVCIVTEETNSGNDLKLFKKIPSICQILEVPVLSLPDLLNKFPEVDLGISRKR
jgi:flagellar biosynthesis/type III secretory pathway chaperone